MPLTLKEMSVSALTPPNQEMLLTSRMTSPIFGAMGMLPCARRRLTGGKGLASIILSVALTLPVRPSSNFTGLDVLLGAACVQGVHQAAYFGNETTADLVGAGEFAVVGVQPLCSTRKRLTWLPASRASAGQVGG